MSKREREAGDDDVGHGEREQKLPSEAHELVITEAGERGSDPYVEKQKSEDFDDKPQDGEGGIEECGVEVGREGVAEGRGGATEEEQRGDAAYGDHVGVLGHEEHGELHGAVFGMVAGDEFGLGLGEIKRRAVGLGIGGHEVDEEGDELEAAEEVPRDEAVGGLDVNDGTQVERAGAEDDADQREAEGKLVTDELGGGAQRAEQRILIVRGPAGERDAVDADGGDAEDDEQRDVDVGDLEEIDAAVNGARAEGYHGDGDQRAAEGDHGREDEERALDGERHEVFLEEELDAVGERLEEAEGADAAGAPAVL